MSGTATTLLESTAVSDSRHDAFTWDGTSGACAWTAASSYWARFGGTANYSLTGEVVVGGVTVTYAWSAEYVCAECPVAPMESSTWVDGVRTGDADWAAHEAPVGVEPWVDDDDDGWAPPTDCDDADPSVNPDAGDLAGDNVDDDCDGAPYDADADGYDTESGPRDCDDADPAVNPGAEEVACDGVDADCEEDHEDCDGDGHHTGPSDCDDGDPTVYQGADDPPGDGVDADCDGADGTDDDGDGHDRIVDCDDSDDLTFPGAEETCGDDHDQDCDGLDCEPDPPPAEEPPAGCATSPSPAGPVVAALALLLALCRPAARA